MAKFFGQRSKYSVRMAILAVAATMSYVLIGLITFWLMMTTNIKYLFRPTAIISVVVVFIMYAPLFLWIYYLYRKWSNLAMSFMRGLRGEDAVAVKLQYGLSDDYSVYSDVVTDKKFGNIDFAVVGPSGVYAVEVKSHSGEIGYNKHGLTNRGKNFEKDFLRQAKREAMQLRDFLWHNTGQDTFVTPVLVFSGYTKVRFGLKPLDGVFVLHKYYLEKFFATQPPRNFPRESVERELMKVTNYK